jgi:diadenosine tetraphosphate (Ap4A) HIT family hydrolase
MINPSAKCPFCDVDAARVWLTNDHAVALKDAFPVSQGHSLVVPKVHVRSLFELPEEVQESIWRMVALVRSHLAVELQPDGFNVGLNDGAAAGQTVPHAHVHVIPRFRDDCADPRGGVRWVIPSKAAYWKREE